MIRNESAQRTRSWRPEDRRAVSGGCEQLLCERVGGAAKKRGGRPQWNCAPGQQARRQKVMQHSTWTWTWTWSTGHTNSKANWCAQHQEICSNLKLLARLRL
eukprot:4489882-Prymnesium_polylepis.2